MSIKNVIALPPAIIPFILKNLDGFNIVLEDGERIVLTAKDGARQTEEGTAYLRQLALQGATTGRPVPVTATAIQPPPRLKFVYRITDKKRTPEAAKMFGFSEPRLKVYNAVYAAGKKGIKSAELMDETGLPHGSLQQILHWLKKQNMISGEPEQ